MELRIWSAIFLVAFTTACQSTRKPSSTAKKADVSQPNPFLGEAVARIATASPPFILNHGTGDDPNPYVVPIKIDEEAQTFHLDLSRYAALFPEPGTLESLTQSLTFRLPDVPADVTKSLDDPRFAVALFKELNKYYHTEAEELGSDRSMAWRVDPAVYLERYRQCEDEGFSASATIGIVTTDCTLLKRQQKSKLTISEFEFLSVYLYTNQHYMFINRMLRARSFQSFDAPMDAVLAIKLDAVDALIALAIISANNKTDPKLRKIYRGLNAPRRACREGSGKIDIKITRDPEGFLDVVSANSAFKRFCEAFGEGAIYQDCAFASSSTKPDIAEAFSGRFEDPGLVLEMNASSGLDVTLLSAHPSEQEILFRPGNIFHVVHGSAAVAIRNPENNGIQLLPCGTTLNLEQARRVSDFWLQLLE
jgi:hypothetical protein